MGLTGAPGRWKFLSDSSAAPAQAQFPFLGVLALTSYPCYSLCQPQCMT